jgi:thioredoxin 1
MKIPGMSAMFALILASVVVAQSPSAAKPASAAPADAKPAFVCDTQAGLASGSLTFARLAELPKGTLLKAGELTITEKDLDAEIAQAPKDTQEQLKKNRFFVLEQLAAKKLLLQAAKAEAAKTNEDISQIPEQKLVSRYLKAVAGPVKVSDDELADYYKNNQATLGGATLEQVKPQIGQFLLQEKQQQAVARHVETLGQRTVIEVAATWAREQLALAGDNPVDKARQSGKPSLVDFGASGCQACDLMAPMLADLKKKFAGQANVAFVHVREQPILASRYNVQSIPVQVFFDKVGKEVFRHMGFFPQDQMEKKLAELGVK